MSPPSPLLSMSANLYRTAICLDLINEEEQIRELYCGHVYHATCLNLWVERGHHDCPLCKYNILGLHQTKAVFPEGQQLENGRGQPEIPRSHNNVPLTFSSERVNLG